ncbi:acyl-CoA dehydrogenase family protein [Derxia gummosa]|uniref:Acyl-CoA dehydrogenase family protein n=1 Tax=Derxia gummosa DSM 723 TaxID=1121388 RepID=A0A8B6XB06_9BURK|nr:acyl-CoA dehydrogenase family protein [Derxia gummosa]
MTLQLSPALLHDPTTAADLAPARGDAADAPPPRALALADLPATRDALVARFARTAARRDQLGGTPKAERDALRASGLLALSIPEALGGLGADWSVVLRTVREFARVDSSIAHLFAFHHLMLATVRLFGSRAQWEPWLRHTARGDWFWGNALNPLDPRATWRAVDGGIEISGRKSFCSGALDSEMLIVSAVGEDDGGRDADGATVAPAALGSGAGAASLRIAAVPTARSGIRLNDDWHNIGQRQTDSGSVEFDRLRVEAHELLLDPGPLATPRASLRPLLAQAILANIYIGIAEGAVADARDYTLREARPWPPSGLARVTDDPHVLVAFGDFHAGLEALRLLGDRAGAAIDAALAQGEALDAAGRAEAALAIASAKVVATRTGLDICNRLFEVTGARSTHAGVGLDRHWRNLRTHTLHDPLHGKLRELGEWLLLGQTPVPGFYS